MRVVKTIKRSSSKGVENFPHLSEGKSRDLAAAKLGVSGRTAEKAAKVVEKKERDFQMKQGDQILVVENFPQRGRDGQGGARWGKVDDQDRKLRL